MATTKYNFTFKFILSYFLLGALAMAVSYFLYTEFKNYTSAAIRNTGENKFIETGTLINLVYETDGFSRLALLNEQDEDFDFYMEKADLLFKKIEDIKALTTNKNQIEQLDSVKALLELKNQNIEQLRILKLTNSKDTSLDDILEEFKKLENSMGKNSVETLVQDPSKLSRQEKRMWESYAAWLNTSSLNDTTKLKVNTVDSMLIASRFIVSEAKKENSKIRQSLQQKENDLIKNDLTISNQLRQIITAFDAELIKNNKLEEASREAIIKRTGRILGIAGIVTGIVILFFIYIILNDFFKAERFKKSLEKSKLFSEHLLKIREQLIWTVSHDLKTPLNTIAGYSELMEQTPLAEKQKYYLQQISASAHFVSRLVDDLLDFSKLEAGKLPLEQIPFSLENLVTQAAKASKDIHAHKDIALHLSLDPKIQDVIFESDPIRIQQIVNNLIGNAFKFTEAGSIQVAVNLSEKKKEKNVVTISVKDTGIGISKENQKLIFKEFTQAETEIAHQYGGNGLGLAISKKLAKLLGGTLTVESTLGKGSTFTLMLLLKETSRAVPKTTKRKADKNFKSLSVLVFDDDHATLLLQSEVFEQMGINCYTYKDFSLFEENHTTPFDLIITDIQMPGIPGFEILKRLQSGSYRLYKGQPVVAMTGSRKYPEAYYLEKGFIKVLKKPFSKNDLLAILTELFPEKVSKKINGASKKIIKKEGPKGPYNLSLLNSFMQNEVKIKELLVLFYTQTEKDLEQLQKAVNERDFRTLNDTAHRMLTMFGQLQAAQIVSLLEKMEEFNETNISEKELKVAWENLKTKIISLISTIKKDTHYESIL